MDEERNLCRGTRCAIAHLDFSLSERAGAGGKEPGEKEAQGDFRVCKQQMGE